LNLESFIFESVAAETMRREENAIIAKCAPAAVAQTEDKWISPHDREDKIKFVRFATERKKQQLSNQLSYAQYASVKNFLQHTRKTRASF
jgi:hypothetical protein